MSINYDELLKKLERPPKEIKTEPFTQEEFEFIAGKMADLGYIHTKTSLKALEAYMSGYGLLLLGDVGTGKTFFFKTLFKAMEPTDRILAVCIEQTKSNPEIYRMSKTIGMAFNDIKDEVDGLYRQEVLFDDIGVEVVANDWGRKFELVPWLVDLRLKAARRTHFTTNLTADQLLERYGARTIDRMHTLVRVIEFKGKSHRQTIPDTEAILEFRKNRAEDEHRQEWRRALSKPPENPPERDEHEEADDSMPF